MSSLEAVWEYREEKLYPDLFGKCQEDIFTLTPDIFTEVFFQDPKTIDPRWLHLGILAFAPTIDRESWLYVTSGGSTPWDSEPEDYNPNEYSGLGAEFVIETPDQAAWPIFTLQRVLAYHVLLHSGCYGEMPPLNYTHRIPCGGPINGEPECALRFIAIAKPFHYPRTVQLESGKFNFLHLVGITEAERDYAQENGTNKLLSLLKSQGACPVTNPYRKEIAF
ncbi:MAG: hypothetical protein K0R08_1919 [Solimicrobium sp.]|jgi:hypothetical protein|nr:hypothetical protein [Solimicrobium sp.]